MDSILNRRMCRIMQVNGTATLGRRCARNSLRCWRAFSTSHPLLAQKSKKPPIKPHKAPLQYKPKPPPPTPPKCAPTPAPKPSFRGRKLPFYAAMIIVGLTTNYAAFHYYRSTHTQTSPSSSQTQTTTSSNPIEQPDHSHIYNTIAPTFDSSISLTETLMRLPSLRRKLCSRAHGDVLEVSIGTGRNLEYYDFDFKGYNGVGKPVKGEKGLKRGNVKSFTALDKSAEMLEVAHEKFSGMFPGILGVRWVIADAACEDEIPAPPKNANERGGNVEGGKYDTIIQTMGLCSCADPVKLLRSLGGMLKEEEGRILLLEHGRGWWGWLNGILDRGAEGHAREFGCWWNRDLGRIVGESGLVVVEERRVGWHGGTTWCFELKKPRGEEKKDGPVKFAIEEVEKTEETKKKGWW